MARKNNPEGLEKTVKVNFARVRIPSSARAAMQMRGFSVIPGERILKEEQEYN